MVNKTPHLQQMIGKPAASSESFGDAQRQGRRRQDNTKGFLIRLLTGSSKVIGQKVDKNLRRVFSLFV